MARRELRIARERGRYYVRVVLVRPREAEPEYVLEERGPFTTMLRARGERDRVLFGDKLAVSV